MGIVNYLNTDRKNKGKSFFNKSELEKIEKSFISFSNKYNFVINFFVNNRMFLSAKDFLSNIFGTSYPEFLYNSQTNEYLVDLTLKYSTKNIFLRWIKILRDTEHTEAEMRTTPNRNYALDTSKIPFWRKKSLRNNANRAWSFNGNGKFEYKRILEYTKLNDSLPEQLNCDYGYDTNDGTGEPRNEQ